MGKLSKTNLGLIVSFYWFYIFNFFQDRLQNEESTKETILTLTQYLNSHAPDWKQDDILSLCIQDFNRLVDHINAKKNIMDLMNAFQIRDVIEKDIQENIILDLVKLSSDDPSDSSLLFIKTTADLWDIDLLELIGDKETIKKISVAGGITVLQAGEETNDDKPSQDESMAIDAVDKDGVTALMRAAMEGQTETVALLLDKNADVDAKDNEGRTALMGAASMRDTETADLLIDGGADIETKDNEGRTALMWLIYASASNETEALELLISKGADIEAKDNKGQTALMYAVLQGDTEITELLIDKGTDIEAKDKYGQTALMHAARSGQTGTAELLIDKGAGIDVQTKGWTALIYALNKDHSETAKLLIDKGADINAEKEGGGTALILASHSGDTKIVELLIEKGADIDAKYKNGRTVLMLAASGEIASMLIADGADIEAKDDEGKTALLHTVDKHKTEITALLIDKGADIEVKDDDLEHTALIMSALRGYVDIVELLLNRGADPSNGDYRGKTALDWVMEQEADNSVPKERRDRIIELLKSSIAEREDESGDKKDQSTEKQNAPVSDEVIKEIDAKDDIVPGKSIQPDAKGPIPVPRYATTKTKSTVHDTQERERSIKPTETINREVNMAKVCTACGAKNPDQVNFCNNCGNPFKKTIGHYDAFISYRRETGSELAQVIQAKIDQITGGKKNVYVDVNELGKGQFDTALLGMIERTPNFIILLTPDSLNRCMNEGDWVRREISHAIKTEKNIIPVMTGKFSFEGVSLPPDIATLPIYNAVQYSHLNVHGSIVRILSFMVNEPQPTPPVVDPIITEPPIFIDPSPTGGWSEFEKAQSKYPKKKPFLPIAKRVHDLLIATLNENHLPFDIRYGDGTISVSVTKDMAKSRTRTFARFGLLGVKDYPYLESLHKGADDPLPQGAKYWHKNDLTQCFYRFDSATAVQELEESIRGAIIKSYRILSKT